MTWDPAAPATSAPLVSAPVRENFAALDATVMAALAALVNGQVLIKSAGPVLGGVAVGAETQVLTVVSGVPAWQAPTSGGMTNPMTTLGDLIIGGASGAANRLAGGTADYVLTMSSGSPAWQPVASMASGTRMLFDQDAAPTGWTRDTTTAFNDRVIRIVTGTRSDGGSWTVSGFTAANHTHAGVDHLHGVPAVGTGYAGGESGSVVLGAGGIVTGVFHTHTTGGTTTGGADRSLTSGATEPPVDNDGSWRPLHRDMIVCVKD